MSIELSVFVFSVNLSISRAHKHCSLYVCLFTSDKEASQLLIVFTNSLNS